MTSLFLGKVGVGEDVYEIHALTNGQSFREIPESSISDSKIYKNILEGRYELLCNGNPIYCTAINPIDLKSIEYNPHDDREGTIHIVALDNNGQIEAAVGVAVDVCDSENGTYIGLPLENRWKPGNYPEGSLLDEFREKYVRLNKDENRTIKPYELAELYRHYKRFGTNNSLARIGLYCGCYHLLVREARLKQKNPTTLWAFDAIPQYFNLYRYAGAAVLRDFTIKRNSQFISPSKKDLVVSKSCIKFENVVVSRNVLTPIPHNIDDSTCFEIKEVPYLDGIIDIANNENGIVLDPHNLSPLHYKGFTSKDKQILKATLSLIGRRSFISDKPELPTGKSSSKILWDFNGVGN